MKPKILFILHYPPPLNGASLMGKTIMESSGIKQNFSGDYINLSTSYELNKIGRGGVIKLFLLLKIILKVTTILLRKKHHLYYMTLSSSGLGFYKDLIIVTILKCFRKKILFHFHNKGVSHASSKKINNLLYRYTFKNTQSILLSPLLYNDIKQFVKERDVMYCFNGIATQQTSPFFPIKKPHKNENHCRLLFLSNMIAEKGVFVLLEACKLLKLKGCSFECHFVGDWVDVTKSQLSDYLYKNELSQIVFAHGPKYDKDKFYHFQHADIFVFPTYYHNETFGLVNLEAMQFGIPVVSTPEGGIPDVVLDGVTGFLVPQKNAEALAEQLLILINNPELRTTMGIAGRERFEKLFTIEKFEKNFIDILTTVIESNSKAANEDFRFELGNEIKKGQAILSGN